VFSSIKYITRYIRFTFSSDRGGIVDKRKLAYYSLIGTVLGGVTGLVPIIACLNFFSLVDGLTYSFVIINIVALSVGFCAAYLIILKSVKSLDWFKTRHWILINSSIGAIFGLLVGYFANTGEVYWFVIGFAIISLIPVVNFLAAASWLGAAIYVSYYPIDLIPILNDILPIHLTDTSMIWITGLPLFAVPLFAFLGYWMVGLISGSYKKRVLAPTKIIDRRGLKSEMGKYKSKLSGWKNEGYNASELEESLKSGNLLSKIQNLRTFESKIQKLKQFEKEISTLGVEGFDYEIVSIKKKLKNPNEIDNIESELSMLKTRIEVKIRKLIDKTEEKIKNAISDTAKSKDSRRLSALKILEMELYNFSEKFRSTKIPYKDAMYNIMDLKHQAETLDIPHEKKHEMPDPIHVKKTNYYDILSIKPDATQEQIKKMFKRLSLAYHPDTEADTGVDGDHRFRTIIEAYETLKYPDKRKKYDLENGIQK